jgi:hypothetical protein
MTFVPFNPEQILAGTHEITEDTSISKEELEKYFPPSSQEPVAMPLQRGTPPRKWTCQLSGCFKSVLRQELVNRQEIR